MGGTAKGRKGEKRWQIRFRRPFALSPLRPFTLSPFRPFAGAPFRLQVAPPKVPQQSGFPGQRFSDGRTDGLLDQVTGAQEPSFT